MGKIHQAGFATSKALRHSKNQTDASILTNREGYPEPSG